MAATRRYIVGIYEEYYNALKGEAAATKASSFITEVTELVSEFSNISNIMNYWSGEAKDAMTSSAITSIMNEFSTTQQNMQESLAPCCAAVDSLSSILATMKAEEDVLLQKENDYESLSHNKPNETIKDGEETKTNPDYTKWQSKMSTLSDEIKNLISELDTMKEEADQAIKTIEDLEGSLKEFSNYMSLTGSILGIDGSNSFSKLSLEERIQYLQQIIDNYDLIYNSLNEVYQQKYGKGFSFSAEDFKNLDIIFDVFDIYWLSGMDRGALNKGDQDNPVLLDIEKLTTIIGYCNNCGIFDKIGKYLDGASWKDSGLEDFYFKNSPNFLKINVYNESQFKARLKNNYGVDEANIKSFLKEKMESFNTSYQSLLESYSEFQQLSSTMAVIKEKISNLKTAQKLMPFEMVADNEDFKLYLEKDYSGYKYLDQEKLSIMSQREIAIYDYLYHNKSKEEASKYLNAMENAFNQRIGAKRAAEYIEWIKQDGFDVRDLFNSGVEGVKDGVRSFGQGFVNLFKAYSIEEGEKSALDYELMYKTQYMQQLMMDPSFIDQNTNETWHGFADLNAWYNTGSSIGNMAIPALVAMIPGGQTLSSVLFGASIMGNTAAEAKSEGYSTAQAYIYGGITGLSEAITERLLGGIQGLSEKAISRPFLANMFNEGFEEFVQEYMDLGTRALVLGEKIDFSAAGMMAQLNKSTEAFKYGAITAGVMNVANTGINKGLDVATKTLSPALIDVTTGQKMIDPNTGKVIKKYNSYGEFKLGVESERSITKAQNVIEESMQKIESGKELSLGEKIKLNNAIKNVSVEELSIITSGMDEKSQQTLKDATKGIPKLSKDTSSKLDMSKKLDQVTDSSTKLETIDFTKEDFKEEVTRDGRTLGDVIADTRSESLTPEAREKISKVSEKGLREIDKRVAANNKINEKTSSKRTSDVEEERKVEYHDESRVEEQSQTKLSQNSESRQSVQTDERVETSIDQEQQNRQNALIDEQVREIEHQISQGVQVEENIREDIKAQNQNQQTVEALQNISENVEQQIAEKMTVQDDSTKIELDPDTVKEAASGISLAATAMGLNSLFASDSETKTNSDSLSSSIEEKSSNQTTTRKLSDVEFSDTKTETKSSSSQQISSETREDISTSDSRTRSDTDFHSDPQLSIDEETRTGDTHIVSGATTISETELLEKVSSLNNELEITKNHDGSYNVDDGGWDETISQGALEQHLENLGKLSPEGQQRYIEAISKDTTLLCSPGTNIELYNDPNYEVITSTFGKTNIYKNKNGDYVVEDKIIMSKDMHKFVDSMNSLHDDLAKSRLQQIVRTDHSILRFNTLNTDVLSDINFDGLYKTFGKSILNENFAKITERMDSTTLLDFVHSEQMKPFTKGDILSKAVLTGTNIFNPEFISKLSHNELVKISEFINNSDSVSYKNYRIKEIINNNNENLMHDVLDFHERLSKMTKYASLIDIKLSVEDATKTSIFDVSSLSQQQKALYLTAKLLGNSLTLRDTPRQIGTSGVMEQTLRIDGKYDIVDYVYANRSLANFIKSHNELFGGAFTENHSKILQVISLMENLDSKSYHQIMEIFGSSDYLSMTRSILNDMNSTISADFATKLRESRARLDVPSHEEDGVTVYDVTDQEFSFMVHAVVVNEKNNHEIAKRILENAQEFLTTTDGNPNLSTSIITNNDTYVYGTRPKLMLGFSEIEGYEIKDANPDDLGSILTEKIDPRTTIFDKSKTRTFDELIKERAEKVSKSSDAFSAKYSEVILDRYDSSGRTLRPTHIVCFDEVNQESIAAAKALGVDGKPLPIYVIHTKSSSGVQTNATQIDTRQTFSEIKDGALGKRATIYDSRSTANQVKVSQQGANIETTIESVGSFYSGIKEYSVRHGCSMDEAYDAFKRAVTTGNKIELAKIVGPKKALLSNVQLNQVFNMMEFINDASKTDVQYVERAISLIMEERHITREVAIQTIKDIVENNNFVYMTPYGDARGILQRMGLREVYRSLLSIEISDRVFNNSYEASNRRFGSPELVSQVIARVDFRTVSPAVERLFSRTGSAQTSTYGVDQSVMYDMFRFEAGDGRSYTYRDAKNMVESAIKEHGVIPAFNKYCSDAYFEFKNKMMTKYRLSANDASVIITCIDNSGACSYATVCNEIYSMFANNEIGFERTFGFPMYKMVNGRRVLNSEELMFDLYLNANSNVNGGTFIIKDVYGYRVNRAALSTSVDPLGRPIFNTDEQSYMSTSKGKNTKLLDSYLRTKGLGFDSIVMKPYKTMVNPYQMVGLIERLIIGINSGRTYGLGLFSTGAQIRMYAPPGSNYKSTSTKTWSEGDGHSVYITGLTEEGLIVSSWGRKYIISYQDLINSDSWILSEDIIGPHTVGGAYGYQYGRQY